MGPAGLAVVAAYLARRTSGLRAAQWLEWVGSGRRSQRAEYKGCWPYISLSLVRVLGVLRGLNFPKIAIFGKVSAARVPPKQADQPAQPSDYARFTQSLVRSRRTRFVRSGDVNLVSRTSPAVRDPLVRD